MITVRCPYCRENDDKVVDSRTGEDGAAIRRRRECLACGRRFTTYERLDEHGLVKPLSWREWQDFSAELKARKSGTAQR